MYQVITIGSALIDVFIRSSNFIIKSHKEGDLLCQLFGSKYSIDDLNVCTGGGASNAAVGYTRLGFKSAIICETGKDYFASIVTQKLSNEAVVTDFIVKEKREQTGGSVILVGDDGRRTVMVHRGAAALLDSYDIPGYRLSQSEWIHLSSIGGNLKTLKKIFSIVKKDENIGLTWNPGSKELQLLAKQQLKIKNISCKIFILNKEEWHSIKNVQKDIFKHCKTVVVTAGSEGGIVYINGELKLEFEGNKVKAVDATGAGDAFSVGLTSALMLKKPLVEAVEWGRENAKSVISYFGAKAGLLTKEKMEYLRGNK